MRAYGKHYASLIASSKFVMDGMMISWTWLSKGYIVTVITIESPVRNDLRDDQFLLCGCVQAASETSDKHILKLP